MAETAFLAQGLLLLDQPHPQQLHLHSLVAEVRRPRQLPHLPQALLGRSHRHVPTLQLLDRPLSGARSTLMASVQPQRLMTLRVTPASLSTCTVSNRLCWSLVIGELWITSISRWKQVLRLSRQAMAWQRELSNEKQPGFSSSRISSRRDTSPSVSQVRPQTIRQKPWEASPRAAMATGVDCLSRRRNSRTATTAAASREGLKSFMPIDLVTSTITTTPRIVCTSRASRCRVVCGSSWSRTPISTMRSTSSILFYLLIPLILQPPSSPAAPSQLSPAVLLPSRTTGGNTGIRD